MRGTYPVGQSAVYQPDSQQFTGGSLQQAANSLQLAASSRYA